MIDHINDTCKIPTCHHVINYNRISIRFYIFYLKQKKKHFFNLKVMKG
jgi:hypothetical protein